MWTLTVRIVGLAALGISAVAQDQFANPAPADGTSQNTLTPTAITPPTTPFVAAAVTVAKPAPGEPRINWTGLTKQSTYFLTVQHAFRLATEPGTRAELKGPFFKDWMESVRGYDGWRDGDPWDVNYVGHPMMGAISGFIYLQNDREGKRQTFGSSGAYWRSRFHAMLFSAAYSTLFELGPVGEAAIGNVGKNEKTSGVVDLVVTPTIGTGWLIAEDIADRYLMTKLEKRIKNRPLKIILRGVLNPSRAFAAMMGGHEPWIRYDRGGLWRRP